MSTFTKPLKPSLGSPEELYQIVGMINHDASGAITSEDISGASVTHDGTGLYSITFDPNAKSAAVRSVQIQPLAATAVDRTVQLVSVSSTVIQFRLLVGATATNPAAVGSLMVHILCRKSGVTR